MTFFHGGGYNRDIPAKVGIWGCGTRVRLVSHPPENDGVLRRSWYFRRAKESVTSLWSGYPTVECRELDAVRDTEVPTTVVDASFILSHGEESPDAPSPELEKEPLWISMHRGGEFRDLHGYLPPTTVINTDGDPRPNRSGCSTMEGVAVQSRPQAPVDPAVNRRQKEASILAKGLGVFPILFG